MRVLEAVDNPWFPIGTFIVELREDEYEILEEFAKTLGIDLHELLQDAVMLVLGRNIHQLVVARQVQTQR